MSPEAVRAAYERVRAEVASGVTVVTATKYVSLEDMAVLAEAGVEVVGENRAQDLERKHAAHGDAFRWHFIGHLQSKRQRPSTQPASSSTHSRRIPPRSGSPSRPSSR